METSLPGLRDIHAHFIYGVDDGAQTVQDMRAMLDAAHENRTTALYATSHRTPGIHHFPEEQYGERLEEARAYCREKGYGLQLYPGAEILYTPALGNYLEHRPLRTLGDSDSVLLEFVPDVSLSEIEEAVSLVEGYGYRPILAHIERYGCLFSSGVFRLKERHVVRYQVNCGTVLKGLGFFKTRHLRRWLREEVIDFISSDTHDTARRPDRMLQAWEALGKSCSRAYLGRLMEDTGDGAL